MKKVLLLLSSAFALHLHANSFLHRDGNVVRDSVGKSVHLNGVNLGGWLLWEGWIWGGGFTKEESIREGLENVGGSAAADSLRMDIYNNFITEQDIKAISLMGLNMVRIPFNHYAIEGVFETFNGKRAGFDVIDKVIGWCKKYHVYALLDMHGAPGGQSPYFIADPDKGHLVWKDAHSREMTIQLWKLIAEHYKNESNVAGYDLLNEPIPNPKDSLLAMYKVLIKTIRAVDPDHMFFIEGANFAKDFSMFKDLPDQNMLFEFHIYTWFGGKPENKMADFAAIGKRLNVPVWCGEWGENTYDVINETLKTLTDPANNFCGWCFWTWKKVKNGYPALNTINVNQSWIDLVKWTSKGSMKNSPGHDAAVSAMREFRTDVLYENNLHDDRLIGLLKRYSFL